MYLKYQTTRKLFFKLGLLCTAMCGLALMRYKHFFSQISPHTIKLAYKEMPDWGQTILLNKHCMFYKYGTETDFTVGVNSLEACLL